MRTTLWIALAGMIIVSAICSETASAQTQPDESQLLQLQTIRRDLDKDLEQGAAGKFGRLQADLLAREFSVPTSVVEDLRNRKQGWGTIAVELAMAHHLSRLDPISYRTVAEALDQVKALRTEGKGWGAISKELGFSLGPVISEMRHVRQDLQIERERLKNEFKADKSMGMTADKVQVAMENAEMTARLARASRTARITHRERVGH